MKQRIVRVAMVALMACGSGLAAEQTWTGRISSAMCSKPGSGMMEHDCILNCIKAGEKYVFVAKDQVHKIENQDFGDLEKQAGHNVKLSGTLGSDGKTITVTKVAVASATQK
jgi:hypothetical protein